MTNSFSNNFSLTCSQKVSRYTEEFGKDYSLQRGNATDKLLKPSINNRWTFLITNTINI